MMDEDEAALKLRYEKAGQGHVFEYIDELNPTEKETLLQTLEGIPVEQLATFLQAALAESSSSPDAIQPFSKPIGRITDPNVVDGTYSSIGMEAIRNEKVAALVLAGGQGTRLGFDGPKGMYDIGLPSGRTLFQLFCERLVRLKQLASGSSSSPSLLPFYIMTSPMNHDETVQYLQSHDYFGLPATDVCCFPQGMLPCLYPEDGKIIMETKYQPAMAPDGNGGIYSSLKNSGMLQDMKHRGIQYLHVFSIDNALCKPADPTFMGYCISQNADCGNKVVWKSHAQEPVGVLAEKDQKPCIVEYSEITTEMAERTDDVGRLVFGAANICNHFYTIDFLETTVLPNLSQMYHVARKKIPYHDKTSNTTIKPSSNNGIKLESFIFDVFPFSQNMAVLDVERLEEFSPVKNPPGSETDSPDTARIHISNLAKKWVTKAGGVLQLTTDDTNSMDDICEIRPLTSYAGEGLEHLDQIELKCPFSL